MWIMVLEISAEAKFLTAHIPYKNTQSAQWGDQSGRSERKLQNSPPLPAPTGKQAAALI